MGKNGDWRGEQWHRGHQNLSPKLSTELWEIHDATRVAREVDVGAIVSETIEFVRRQHILPRVLNCGWTKNTSHAKIT